MTYAIIETGGKQLRVEPGRFYEIELLPVEPEEDVTIEKVLLIQHESGVHIGQPFVEGATIEATVLQHRRGRKVIVYKMRPKKKTRKKRGHRQEITRLMINSISLNGLILSAEEAPQAEPESAPPPEAQLVVAPVDDAPVAEETPAEIATPEDSPENSAE